GEGGDWCTMDQAIQIAAMVVAMRPTTVLEIGVWRGGSLIPMALAAKYNRRRIETAEVGPPGNRVTVVPRIADVPQPTTRVIAIDPWTQAASIAGEEPANIEWWGKVDH